MTIIDNDSVTTIHPDGSVTVGGPAEAQASRAMMQAQMNDMTMQMQASMGGMNRCMSGMNRSMSGMNRKHAAPGEADRETHGWKVVKFPCLFGACSSVLGCGCDALRYDWQGLAYSFEGNVVLAVHISSLPERVARWLAVC